MANKVSILLSWLFTNLLLHFNPEHANPLIARDSALSDAEKSITSFPGDLGNALFKKSLD